VASSGEILLSPSTHISDAQKCPYLFRTCKSLGQKTRFSTFVFCEWRFVNVL